MNYNIVDNKKWNGWVMSFLHHRFLRHKQKSLFTKGINSFPMNNNFKNKTLLEKLQLTKITFKELFQDFNEIAVTKDIHTIDYEKDVLSIIATVVH